MQLVWRCSPGVDRFPFERVHFSSALWTLAMYFLSREVLGSITIIPKLTRFSDLALVGVGEGRGEAFLRIFCLLPMFGMSFFNHHLVNLFVLPKSLSSIAPLT